MKIKGILFDFNGTMLFDSELQEKAWEGFLRSKLNKDISNDPQMKQIFNDFKRYTGKEHWKVLIQEYKKEEEAAWKCVEEAWSRRKEYESE